MSYCCISGVPFKVLDFRCEDHGLFSGLSNLGTSQACRQVVGYPLPGYFRDGEWVKPGKPSYCGKACDAIEIASVWGESSVDMSQWKLLDFICPAHGKFEVLTDKRDGEPAPQPCPRKTPMGLMDPLSAAQELLAKYPDGNYPCELLSPVATTNAVNWHTKRGEVSRGKNTEALPPHILSTEALADGMPMSEWKAKQKQASMERTRKANREMVS